MRNINSDIEICNLALLKIGQETISAIENNSVQAKLCDYNYDIAKNSLLSLYNWSFSLQDIKLAEVIDEPDPDAVVSPHKLGRYSKKFKLPKNFVRLVALYNQNWDYILPSPTPPYDICSGLILTNESEVNITYVANDCAVSLFSPCFIETLVIGLAIKMSKVINDSSSFQTLLMQEFQISFAQAKQQDVEQKRLSSIISYPLYSTYRSAI